MTLKTTTLLTLNLDDQDTLGKAVDMLHKIHRLVEDHLIDETTGQIILAEDIHQAWNTVSNLLDTCAWSVH